MVWATNRPSEVTALQQMLLSVSPWSGWAASGNGLHYPQLALPGDNTPDPLPAGVIVSDGSHREGYAAGVKGLLSGTIYLIVYAPSNYESSDLEKKCRDILDALVNLYTGLANLDGDVGLSSDPSPGARAVELSGTGNGGYRSCKISMTFGLRGN